MIVTPTSIITEKMASNSYICQYPFITKNNITKMEQNIHIDEITMEKLVLLLGPDLRHRDKCRTRTY